MGKFRLVSKAAYPSKLTSYPPRGENPAIEKKLLRLLRDHADWTTNHGRKREDNFSPSSNQKLHRGSLNNADLSPLI